MTASTSPTTTGPRDPAITQCGLFAEPSNDLQHVRLDSIDPSPQPWHIRRSIDAGKLDELLDAIRSTSRIEPLRLVQLPGSRLVILTGVLRYHAAMRLRLEGGPDTVEAIVQPNADPRDLLRWSILESMARYAPSQLELGWALARLRTLLAQESEGPVSQKVLMQHLRLPLKRWKSRVSEALAAAEVLPETIAERVAEQRGCTVEDMAKQPRSVYRQLAAASPEAQPALRDVLGDAVANELNPTRELTGARKALEDPEVLNLAKEALEGGAAVTSVLPPRPASAAQSTKLSASKRSGRLQRIRCALGRAWMWLRRLVNEAVLKRPSSEPG